MCSMHELSHHRKPVDLWLGSIWRYAADDWRGVTPLRTTKGHTQETVRRRSTQQHQGDAACMIPGDGLRKHGGSAMVNHPMTVWDREKSRVCETERTDPLHAQDSSRRRVCRVMFWYTRTSDPGTPTRSDGVVRETRALYE